MVDWDKRVERIQRGEAGRLERTGTILGLLGTLILYIPIVVFLGLLAYFVIKGML